MSHVRKQIKDALKAKLEASEFIVASLHVDRDAEFDPEELPAVSIHNIDSEEAVQLISVAFPRRIGRTFDVFVDCLARHSEKTINAVDELASQVEKTIFDGEPLLGGLIKKFDLISTRIGKTSDVNAEVAVARLTFRVEYHTREGAPEVAV